MTTKWCCRGPSSKPAEGLREGEQLSGVINIDMSNIASTPRPRPKRPSFASKSPVCRRLSRPSRNPRPYPEHVGRARESASTTAWTLAWRPGMSLFLSALSSRVNGSGIPSRGTMFENFVASSARSALALHFPSATGSCDIGSTQRGKAPIQPTPAPATSELAFSWPLTSRRSPATRRNKQPTTARREPPASFGQRTGAQGSVRR